MGCDFVGWGHLDLSQQAAWVQAVGSIVAIFAAVGIGWWSSHLSIRTARIQVLPYLVFERIVERGRIAIVLRNGGMGPALIKEVNITLDNVPARFASATYWSDLVDVIRMNGSASGMVVAPGDVIGAGEVRDYICFPNTAFYMYDEQEINDKIDRIGVEVTYESIHGEKRPVLVLKRNIA